MKHCSPHPAIKQKSKLRRMLSAVSHAVVSKNKIWKKKTLYVCFLDGDSSQHDIVMAGMYKWASVCGIEFGFVDDVDVADIRVSFNYGGAWSTVGTDANYVTDKTQPTMNFGFLGMATALHEVGHALGFNHEHQNPSGGIKWNRSKVIKSLSGPPNNWDMAKINHNVLNRVDETKVRFSPFDPKSIMLYFFPDEWTLDGNGTKQNETLSSTDIEWALKFYPKAPPAPSQRLTFNSTTHVVLLILCVAVSVLAWLSDVA